jgi:hypothetical protein
MEVRLVTVFVASPGDVDTERDHVAKAAAALNSIVAEQHGVQFKVLGWKTHARAGVHKQGPQGPIDEDMPLEKCDIVVGILWKRLGVGTEGEIRRAIAAKLQSDKPEVVICFNDAPFRPKDVAESRQATKVLEFREEISSQHLELAYEGAYDFPDKIRNHLEQYLKAHHPVRPERVTAAITGDPSRYIKALREETSHFDVQGLIFGDNRAYRFPIEEFYIPLTTSSGAGADAAKRGEMRAGPIPLEEALLAHRKLFVVGDPGSGKSTFLKRRAFELCRDWAEGAPLPVRIEAAVLSTYISLHHTKTGPADACGPEWIPLFLGAQCEEKNRELPAGYFRARLKAGGCHVLIDGLDETPDEPSRVRMAKLIREAAGAFDGCRFVVTSRPEGKVPIQGFEEALIGDLEPGAIRAFLAKVAKQLYPEDESKERTFREDLEAAVNGRREIRKMTRNPVMLTALAVLQHNNVKLPEKRVDLYGSILEWLSKQRAKPGRMAASDCLLRLRELALEMQNHEEGRQKQVPLAWAGEKLAKRFANREAAERFLRAEQSDSGIVVSRGAAEFFWSYPPPGLA